MKTKMLFLLFSVVLGSDTLSQTTVRKIETLSLRSFNSSADLGKGFAEAINISLREQYPSTVEDETIVIRVDFDGDSVKITYEAKIYWCDQSDADYTIVSTGYATSKKNEFRAQRIALRKTHKMSEEMIEKINKKNGHGATRMVATGQRAYNTDSLKGLVVVEKFIIIKRFKNLF